MNALLYFLSLRTHQLLVKCVLSNCFQHKIISLFMQLFASPHYSKINFYWSSQWLAHCFQQKGKPCHANSGHYREASSMTVSAFLFQKSYLVFFCFKQREKMTINRSLLHKTGCNTKGKIAARELRLLSTGIKAAVLIYPKSSPLTYKDRTIMLAKFYLSL